MVKVPIEVRSETARFAVAVQAKSIQQALSIVATRYPGSVASVKFPIDPECTPGFNGRRRLACIKHKKEVPLRLQEMEGW